MQTRRASATALLFGLAILLTSCRGPTPPPAQPQRWAGKGVLCADLDEDDLDEIATWTSEDNEGVLRVYDGDQGVPHQVYTLTTPEPLTTVASGRLLPQQAALILCHGSLLTTVHYEAAAYVDSEPFDVGAALREAVALDADGDDVEEVAVLVGGEEEDGALRGASVRLFRWRRSALQEQPTGAAAVSDPAMLTPIPEWPGETARLLLWGQTFRSLEPTQVAFPVIFAAVGGGLLPLWQGPETARRPQQCLFGDLDGDGNLDMLAANPLAAGGYLLCCYNAAGGRLEDPVDAAATVDLLSLPAIVRFDEDRAEEIALASRPGRGSATLAVRKWDEGQLGSVWWGDVSEAACCVAAGNILGDVGEELVCLDGGDLVIVSRSDGQISMTRH